MFDLVNHAKAPDAPIDSSLSNLRLYYPTQFSMEIFIFRVNEIEVYEGSSETPERPPFDLTDLDYAFNGVAIEDPHDVRFKSKINTTNSFQQFHQLISCSMARVSFLVI